MKLTDTVIALIVTYNRKDLLRKSLNATLGQSFLPNRIVILDNNSDDGTDAMFTKGSSFDSKKIDYVKLNTNIGGAGGFHEGIKYIIGHYQFDWIWLYDDDTIPNQNALEELVLDSHKINGSISFVASSVFSKQHQIMNIPSIDGTAKAGRYPDWNLLLGLGMVKIKQATFVSLLIKSDAILKVGLPIKEYFIWGDDSEYTLRLTKFFGPAYLSGNSIVQHLRKSSGNLSVRNESDPKRISMLSYLYRNQLLNDSMYRSKTHFIKTLILTFLTSFSFMFPLSRISFQKFLSVQKGIFEFIIFDKKILKSRFKL
ncbi:MAG: glycosyltransferase [Oenococcus sp.]|uniref:glycosyltransferase n=1 Tax=Oenococcus sp. TaxID=1979414 RepID=UPI0039EAF172